MKKDTSGFTIVELLIVIVVIGILAAISIVAYNGIQQRAENTKTFTAVRAYQQAFITYGSDNGAYPATSLGCLGEDYPADRCWNNTGSYVEVPALATALKTVMGATLPMPSTKNSPNAGAIYLSQANNYTLDGNPVGWLVYLVDGSTTKCTVGPIATYTGGIAFSSTPPASGQTVAGTTPSCWIPLPRI